MKTIIAAALILGAASAAAGAAEPPKVVGTWKSNGDMAAARFGKGPFFDPAKPTLYKDENVISYRIELQQGRAFAGVVVGSGGKEAALAGVFQADGRSFIFSDAFGSGFGSVADGVIELCWTDSLPDYVSAACGSFKPVPAP
ncbi:hypothetical protein EZH22_08110 [Xanthobacter dioxanivorans]|uniref:DUF2147 domain-containing protein n=1 Tax=Xanthobacter dioxanivorans TaxID=2528964 RepID=A0A974PSD4_9HYPH|nr:hypothetical protein [Xanthobacter dioxanivorans]QRG08255.1 hypothetical protein EZH22_08110 [Xanthobacter dioxanivorans]